MPGKQLNPQHPVPHQQCSPCHQAGEEFGTAHTGSDEEGHGRAYTGLIKSSKRAQFSNTLQELREAVTVL